MALSNSNFATAFTALLTSNGVSVGPNFAGDLTTLLDQWTGLDSTNGRLTARVVELINRADRVRQDISVAFAGPVGISELLGVYLASGHFAISPSACRAYAEGAPGSSKVVEITKNNLAWATVTWSTGQSNGVFSFVDAEPDLEPGDTLRFIAPANFSPEFRDLFLTLKGT